MTSDYVIAIPSYKRSDLIVTHTLAYLASCSNISMSNVYVFVGTVTDATNATDASTDTELTLYQRNVAARPCYAAVNLVTGPVGLHNMRNFITDYFQDGTCVLQMDDDVKTVLALSIDTSVTDTQKAARYPLVDIEGFDSWVRAAFTTLKQRNLSLFGVYPVKNGFFMKDLPEVTYDLRFCVGVLWGCINRKNLSYPSITLTLEEKEDFERTLLHWCRDGGVVRFNHITIKTKYYTTPGGMQARGIDRQVAAMTSCRDLCSRFPDLCRLYLGKKSGMPEVRLRA